MLKIVTLGEFDVRIDDESIIEDIGSQSRLLLLLKYFLAHKGKRLLPDTIVEDLMEDKDLKEPQNVLRTQISRLRRLFEDNTFYTIDFLNGYYTLNLSRNCSVDFVILENQISYGNRIFEESPEMALDILRNGLLQYKGLFLPEIEYDEWIIPIRNRLDRMYVKGLSNYLSILKQGGQYHEIIEICEGAIDIKPYEEFINKYFMEALMMIGQKRFALSHYEYYTSKLYNDLKIVPSLVIKEVYKKLLSHEDKPKEMIEITNLENKLKIDRYDKGALICEINYFKFIYNWELRNKLRKSRDDVFLSVITLDYLGYAPLTEEDVKNGMSLLLLIVYKSLRKTDILSKWNDRQLVTLLYDISEKDLYLINNRLQNNFLKEIKNKNITLNVKFKPL